MCHVLVAFPFLCGRAVLESFLPSSLLPSAGKRIPLPGGAGGGAVLQKRVLPLLGSPDSPSLSSGGSPPSDLREVQSRLLLTQGSFSLSP